MVVKPSSYEALEYPDNYPDQRRQRELRSRSCRAARSARPTRSSLAAGQYSGNDCSPATVGGLLEVFGFFRTIVQTYFDRNYGATED